MFARTKKRRAEEERERERREEPREGQQRDIAEESLAARDPVNARVGRGGMPRSRPLENE
jgi:hypothetical protein